MAQNQVLAGFQQGLNSRLDKEIQADIDNRKAQAEGLYKLISSGEATDEQVARAEETLKKLFPQSKDLFGKITTLSRKLFQHFKPPPGVQDTIKSQTDQMFQTAQNQQAVDIDPNVADTYSGMLEPPPSMAALAPSSAPQAQPQPGPAAAPTPQAPQGPQAATGTMITTPPFVPSTTMPRVGTQPQSVLAPPPKPTWGQDISKVAQTSAAKKTQQEIDKERRVAEIARESKRMEIEQNYAADAELEGLKGKNTIELERERSRLRGEEAEPFTIQEGTLLNKKTGAVVALPPSVARRAVNMQGEWAKYNGKETYVFRDMREGREYLPTKEGLVEITGMTEKIPPQPPATIQIMNQTRPSAQMPPELKSAVERATMSITSPTERLGTMTAVNNMIESGDIPNAISTIKQIALENDRSANAAAVTGRRETMAALLDIQDLLKAVPQNLLVGTAEDVVRKLGASTDPRYVEIGNQLLITLQAYRKGVTGAQFGVQETGEYSRAFPSYSNTAPVNDAQIKGLLEAFKRNDKIYWETKLGKGRDWTDYAELAAGRGVLTPPPTGGRGTTTPPPTGARGAGGTTTPPTGPAGQFKDGDTFQMPNGLNLIRRGGKWVPQ